MKKIVYISLAVLIAATTLQSCNKKFKDQVEALDKSVDDLKTKNSELEAQLAAANATVNNVAGPFGTNEVLTWTFNGTDDVVMPNITLSKTYYAKLLVSSKASSQFIEDYGGGIWRVYVEKLEDFDYDNSAYFEFYVNTNTNTLSSIYNNYFSGNHYEGYNGGTNIFTNLSSTLGTSAYFTAKTAIVNPITGDVNLDIDYTDSTGTSFGEVEKGNIKFKGKFFIYNN